MLTPASLASILSTISVESGHYSPLGALEARLAVLDALLASKAPQTFHVTLEPHPLAFGAPMARAVDWEAFGPAVLGTTAVLPNDSRWVKGGAK